jgi:hypothetical protein
MIERWFKNLKSSNLNSYFQTNKIKLQNKIENFSIFQICELLDEFEVISLNDITNKIFITDLSCKKNNLFFAPTFVSDHN